MAQRYSIPKVEHFNMLNALSAGQEEGSTPMNSKPMPQKAVTEIALLVVLMLTTVICAAVVVVVIIFYLRCWHRKGGDKIANGKERERGGGERDFTHQNILSFIIQLRKIRNLTKQTQGYK